MIPTYLNNTSIELIRPVDGRKIQHAVLDFDGTISLIRDGWQNVRVPMMVEILMQTPTSESKQQHACRTLDSQTSYHRSTAFRLARHRGRFCFDPGQIGWYRNMLFADLG